MLNTILVPYDGSEPAMRALEFASDLAAKYGAEIVIFHAIHYPVGLPEELHHFAVSEHLDAPDEIGAVVRKMLESATLLASKAGAEQVAGDSVVGDPAEVILAAAKSRDADLIVMGSRGFGRLEGLLLGSVSDKVLRHADAPVTIVR